MPCADGLVEIDGYCVIDDVSGTPMEPEAGPEEPAETPDEGPEEPAETPEEGPEGPAETPEEGPEEPAETPEEGPEEPEEPETPCGDLYWRCCEGSERCKSNDLACVEIDGEAACIPCGKETEPACTGASAFPTAGREKKSYERGDDRSARVCHLV